MPMTEPSLAALLDPVPEEEFFDRYWERRHLVVHRDDRSHFSPVLGYAGFDTCLHAARRTAGQTVLVVPPADRRQPGRKLRGEEIADKALYAEFSDGCTLVVQQAERLWPALETVSAVVGEALSASVVANLYLTPARSQGFGVHFDTHDAFIAQVEGSKEWHLYESACELPLEPGGHQNVLGVQARREDPEAQALIEVVRLERGDLLYLPRGLVHKAVATEEASLHVTFGLHVFYWSDLLKAAVEVLSAGESGLRRALPPGFAAGRADAEAMRATFASLLESFASGGAALFEPAVEGLARTRRAKQGYPPDGHFGQLAGLDRLSDDSTVARRAGISVRSRLAGDSAFLVFGPHEMRGPGRLRPAFDHVCGRSSFRVGDLPGLDAAGRATLVRRLIRDGLLRIVD